jgi:hypothetical protein
VKDLKDRTEGFNDCRYAVFDFKFTTFRAGAGPSKMNKIVFIQVHIAIIRLISSYFYPFLMKQLCPDGASIKKKMLYASSAQAIKASIGTERILQFQVCPIISYQRCMTKIGTFRFLMNLRLLTRSS